MRTEPYFLTKVLDEGEDGDTVFGEVSESFTPDNEILDRDSLPVLGRKHMVSNTRTGDLMETAEVKEIYDRWTDSKGAENVLFTDGREVYVWSYGGDFTKYDS